MSELYRVKRACEGRYDVIDTDDGWTVAHVGRFMPGPMISCSGPSILSPLMARAVARAMTRLANELERS